MNNVYTVAYTVYNPTRLDEKPSHKKYTFESENDLLAAADEGMCAMYDKYRSEDDGTDILFRGITLDNAKEVYAELIKPLNGDKDE